MSRTLKRDTAGSYLATGNATTPDVIPKLSDPVARMSSWARRSPLRSSRGSDQSHSGGAVGEPYEMELHVLWEGLVDGLSRYLRTPARLAFIYSKPGDRYRIQNNHGLLTAQHVHVVQLFMQEHERRAAGDERATNSYELSLLRAGILPVVGTPFVEGGPATYWFLGFPPEHRSLEPLRQWLRFANLQAVDALAIPQDVAFAYPGRASSHALSSYAEAAIREAVSHWLTTWQQRSDDSQRMTVFANLTRFLRAVRMLSLQREEGAFPQGSLLYFPSEHAQPELDFRFGKGSEPRLDNPKHVRKLLQAVDSAAHLVAVADRVVGIGNAPKLGPALLVRFWGTRGELRFVPNRYYDGMPTDHGDPRLQGQSVPEFGDVASLVLGEWFGVGPAFARLEQALRAHLGPGDRPPIPEEARELDEVVGAVEKLMRLILERGKGCTLVIDRSETGRLCGHSIERMPSRRRGAREPGRLELDDVRDLADERRRSLIAAMSQVDGAVHLDAHGIVRGFGCLLDGAASGTEDLARGARFNSAMRFSRANPDCLVIVVSADGPLTIFPEGPGEPQPPALDHIPSDEELDDWQKRMKPLYRPS